MFSEIEIARLQVRQDKYFEKLEEKSIEEIISKGISVGESYSTRYTMPMIKEELLNRGFKIEYVENTKNKFNFRAELIIDDNEKKILIYIDTVKKSIEEISSDVKMTEEQIIDLYLAHEFFHILEHDENIKIDVEPVTRFTFLGKKFQGEIHACYEIAANTFAQKVNDSKINPIELDLYHLYGNKGRIKEVLSGKV